MANGFMEWKQRLKIIMVNIYLNLIYSQTALLAGMPQAPNSYDPYTKPDTAKERRDVVLYTMYDNKKSRKPSTKKPKLPQSMKA